MTDAHVPTREQLLVAMTVGRMKVHAFVANVGEDALMHRVDSSGWSGRDHLAHLNAWEGALISWLTNGTRAEGLGIDEAIWETRNIDHINEAARSATLSMSIVAILAQLDRNRARLRDLVIAMSDSDLMAPYFHFPSNDPTHLDPPVASRVLRVVGSHVDDHLGYIDRLVAAPADSVLPTTKHS